MVLSWIVDRLTRIRSDSHQRPPSEKPRIPSPTTRRIADAIEKDRHRWSAARSKDNGPRVLVATNVTGFAHVSLLESMLAAALTLRGARVEIAMCDAALPACLKVEPHVMSDPGDVAAGAVTRKVCDGCQAVGQHHLVPLGLPVHHFSSLLSEADRHKAREMVTPLDRDALVTLRTDAGDKVGMQGLAGALRYFARAELPDGEVVTEVLRRFVEAALLTAVAFEALLVRERYDVAVFHHGIYVPQGPAGDVLRRHGVHVINWNPSYRRSTFIFSHGDSYHYTMMEEPTASWETMSWHARNEEEITGYLASRATGSRDWIWFHEKPEHDSVAFTRELGLDTKKPIIGMLSNVAWDAQLHYPANAFSNMLEWVFETITYFAGRPDLQLLLRIHPAEIRGTVPSAQPLGAEIAARFPLLPPNVFVIAAESNISTYAAMELCDTVIVYGTKTGVELTAVGIPVIVAGEAWVRGKGITMDASDARDYFALLDRLPLKARLDPHMRQRALRYAYHFFFRRMIPLRFIVPQEGKTYALALHDLAELEPERHPGLDVVCNGVLTGAPFIYEAERLGLGE